MKRDEARRVMHRLRAAYPTFPLDEATVTVYLDHLEQFDLSEAMRAVDEHVRRSRFFPTVSEIRDLVHGSREDGDRDERRRRAAQNYGSVIARAGYGKEEAAHLIVSTYPDDGDVLRELATRAYVETTMRLQAAEGRSAC